MKEFTVKYKKILTFFCLIYILTAINNPLHIPDQINDMFNINFLRGIAPGILLPFFLIYIVLNFKKLKIDIVYILFFFYIAAQIPYYFLYDFITFSELYWIISGLSLLSFFLILNNEDFSFNKYVFKIFIFVVLMVAVKFTYTLYFEYLTEFLNQPSARASFYGFETMAPEASFLNQPVPRSSGLARLLMVIWLFLFTSYIYKISKVKNIFFIIALIFLNFTIYHLQSRLIFIYQFCLIIFLIFFPIYNLNLRKKFTILFLIFILPYIFHIVEPKVRNYAAYSAKVSEINVFNQENKNKPSDKKDFLPKPELNLKKELDVGKILNDQRITHTHLSGRKELWNETLVMFKLNNFLGFGPQADRVLLKQNVSGLYFYSIICGGVISLISIVALIFVIIFRIFKLIIFEKIFQNKEKFFCLSILLIGLLLVRSIGEITFGIFGIDMFIFFVSYNILSKFTSLKEF